MAIEKMKIMSIIGRLTDLDKAARLLVLDGSTHILNALSELNSNYFSLSASEEHLQALQELSDLRPYSAKRDFAGDESLIKSFHELFDIKEELDSSGLTLDYQYEDDFKAIRERYEKARSIIEQIKAKTSNIQGLEKHIENLQYLRNSGWDIGVLQNRGFIEFKLLMLTNENYRKLQMNLENIPSIIIQVAAIDRHVAVAAFTPGELREDAERVFISLNYRDLELPKGYAGTAEEITKQLSSLIEAEKNDIEELKKSVRNLKEEYGETIRRAYGIIELEKRTEKIKSEVAIGKNLFFMFGFVPQSRIKELQEQVRGHLGDGVIILVEDVEKERTGHAPPTKIKNNPLFRPFESLVSMYGIPNYNEKDPTPFFAVTYMLLFGAMFGDVGQGLVIFLAGLVLGAKMADKSFGGILARLGISSMLFGGLYGSVFGAEEVIPALLIRPMANINTMLISAIVLGIVFITVSYVISLLNLYARKDLEEGIFGKEGLAGFIFFWTLVFTIGVKATGVLNVPTWILAAIMAALLLLMVFKQPLANMLAGRKKLYDESPADYYIEAGFGIIETLLSITSNIISFIRVGAFALNHVGLYIAFSTMAQMINSRIGGFIILIVGNIIIIGLEGLIVFIQSLRLEYYELFSKYYSGYGVEYRPVSLYNTGGTNEDSL